MPEVILLCGKICSGKTTYAQKLRKERNAVVLSCDELMLTLFPQGAGEHHDMLAQRARDYQFALSRQLTACGLNVILDWGFWTKAWRDEARAFYAACGIPCQLHYVSVSPDTWRKHIDARNQAVRAGQVNAYLVDAGLLLKLASRFEEPEDEEIQVLYRPE